MNPARIVYHPATLIGLLCLVLFALGGLRPEKNTTAATAPQTQQTTAPTTGSPSKSTPAVSAPAPSTQTNPYTVPPLHGEGGEGGFDD